MLSSIRYSKTTDISGAITSIRYLHGTTNTALAMEYVREEMFTRENGARQGVPWITLVITDGESNDPEAAIDEARRTRDAGIDILTLGIGSWIIKYELEGMASHPKTRNMFEIRDYESLFLISDLLIGTICDGKSSNINVCPSLYA